MSIDEITARPYAKAVFEIALEKNDFSRWSELLAVLAFIAQDLASKDFLGDPRITCKQRAALFIDVAAKQLDKTAKNFIAVLSTNGRLTVLPTIAHMFEDLRCEYENRLNGEIISAFVLNKEQREKLHQTLVKRFGCDVSLSFRNDKTLIGGVIIKVGDFVIDGSVRKQLNRLQNFLNQ